MTGTISADDYNELTKRPAPSKYGNRRVKVDGYTFDSAAEHRRYCDLKLLAEAGEISELIVHPQYDLIVNGCKIGRYVADFEYLAPTGRWIVEDTKGVKTPIYQLKKKMIKAIYNIDIEEIEA